VSSLKINLANHSDERLQISVFRETALDLLLIVPHSQPSVLPLSWRQNGLLESHLRPVGTKCL